jgi:hypothetical protein
MTKRKYYEILQSTPPTYIINRGVTEKNKATSGTEIAKMEQILGAKHSNLKDKLSSWFCQ